MPEPTLILRDVAIYKGWLDPLEQEALIASLRDVVAQAPLFQPVTPSGRAMSVRMTSAGRCGWISDRNGYRYAGHHPDGMGWPPIPETVLAIWRALVSETRLPDCCLINHYTGQARMGLHQDRDEADFTWPVLSISLGDDALFRIGNVTRGGKTDSLWLASGDVVVMGGAARLVYHGIDRIRPGTSGLLRGGGRINLTCRVVM
ncbi:Alpha-ketoglutarate-dependent dioxygenase AlkB homolog [Roseovarius sp. EC-HK134]|jgi:alkylated DNA repair protein (DNA oxidative demethylase)|uniref:alpha-ketoglutarate-dependent dioxygenase AlkB family protein n=1 Tax=Roseovarius TaxID=74030 RepID=UPI0001557480|nr:MULTISPECIES: alpha-ketoglutarate-dependent dioxygenase AlkB [Roseovarius]AWZ20025.1 Alkylated DNA repair protein AlkB [Roseovarius sp. AK1035]EDM31543.1 alkylated DNA repair protein, putative [Roseovarius sp. TM1035]MBW4972897.1 alpha-ketoglutarate-dependent dioxygenase AlkB [Roseovarius mucosus]VVT11861.1 Alpha-ketoglutarate-dependent dioxygenase AlkB homolog [Roseovarius sp. EC-HK134]VVT12012.1 Alpha-ketoglutarate-dependent dioxygenase AlkB homolog [Roseovarius sp. EC-SD190]|tara:strand:- start:161 stop:769 length:609 start_codon:yes stop_codon:yes gene_type:complete